MKKQFVAGDKIKVVGHALDIHGDWQSSYWVPAPAKVLSVTNGGSTLQIKTRGQKKTLVVASGQCKLRRFKPKPKPVKKGARRVWLSGLPNTGDYGVCGVAPKKAHAGCAEFIELLPGFALVSREILEKAIKIADSKYPGALAAGPVWAIDLYEALGLEKTP